MCNSIYFFQGSRDLGGLPRIPGKIKGHYPRRHESAGHPLPLEKMYLNQPQSAGPPPLEAIQESLLKICCPYSPVPLAFQGFPLWVPSRGFLFPIWLGLPLNSKWKTLGLGQTVLILYLPPPAHT